MIIGENTINYNTLRSYSHDLNGLVSYVRSMIPIWAIHIPHIEDNQRYYVALHLRKVLSIPYKLRKEMVETLVDGIHISGSVSGFVTIHDIISMCDRDKLLEALLDEDDRGDLS